MVLCQVSNPNLIFDKQPSWNPPPPSTSEAFYCIFAYISCIKFLTKCVLKHLQEKSNFVLSKKELDQISSDFRPRSRSKSWHDRFNIHTDPNQIKWSWSFWQSAFQLLSRSLPVLFSLLTEWYWPQTHCQGYVHMVNLLRGFFLGVWLNIDSACMGETLRMLL